MARRDRRSADDFEVVNALLLTAWERGARHVVLTREGDGTEIHFLDLNGAEHHERLSLPYDPTAARLRVMGARFGHGVADIGGQRWRFGVNISKRSPADQLFLHLRAAE
jgi:hypothetical protein